MRLQLWDDHRRLFPRSIVNAWVMLVRHVVQACEELLLPKSHSANGSILILRRLV